MASNELSPAGATAASSSAVVMDLDRLPSALANPHMHAEWGAMLLPKKYQEAGGFRISCSFWAFGCTVPTEFE